MKIQISEVWNESGKSVQLAVITVSRSPRYAVMEWISANRPDLSLADGLFSHGYSAKEVA